MNTDERILCVQGGKIRRPLDFGTYNRRDMASYVECWLGKKVCRRKLSATTFPHSVWSKFTGPSLTISQIKSRLTRFSLLWQRTLRRGELSNRRFIRNWPPSFAQLSKRHNGSRASAVSGRCRSAPAYCDRPQEDRTGNRF